MLVDNIKNDHKEVSLQMAELMQDSALNAFELLNNLLKWANLQRDAVSFNPQRLDLVGILDKELLYLKNNATQKSISIISKLPKAQPVIADENMLRATIRNLISNAIKFTPTGGTVTVSAEQQGNKLTISFSDTGIGMTQGEIEKLFNFDTSFSKLGTNSEKGTGLGLILCWELVQKHGGTIWVKSEPEKGTIFSFNLPV